MVENKHIKLSPVGVWVLTAMIGTFITISVGWKNNIDTELKTLREDQIETNGLIRELNNGLKENLELYKDLKSLALDFGSIRTQCNNNTNDLASRRGQHFLMPDYDRYVRPVQNDLLERVTKLEAKWDN